MGIGILFALLVAFAIQGTPLFAQVKSSAITGVVTDQSGALVPNATVTVTEQQTSTTTTVKTTGKGEYTVPYLPIGTYTLQVSAPGFKTYRKTDINLGATQTVREDVQMSVGSTATSVQVQANALALQTENAQVQASINKNLIAVLPNINSNPLYYATLQAGIVPTSQNLSGSSLGVGYEDRQNMAAFRTAGGELGTNDIQLDGTSVQGAAWHELAVIPNPDSLQEVQTITNSFTADTGLAEAVVSMTTKSGTNHFHGDLNFMLRNEDLNANSWGNDHNGLAKQRYRVLQGGGSIGGPVIIPHLFNGRDKLFFFGSFLRLTHQNPESTLTHVPTALEQAGDFSASDIGGTNGSPVPVNIYDPFSATPVAGSNGTEFSRTQYPANAVANGPEGANQYGLKIMSGYPAPNHGSFNGANSGIDAYQNDNYYFAGEEPETRNNFDGRIDVNVAHNQSIYVTGGYTDGAILVPNEWGPGLHGGYAWNLQPFPGGQSDYNPYGSIGDTIVLNPTTVVDIRYGITRINNVAGFNTVPGSPSAVGMLPSISATAAFQNDMPDISSYSNGGSSYAQLNNNDYGNKHEHQTNHAMNGSITKQYGRWTFKEGGEYRVYLGNWADIQYQVPTLTSNNYTGQLSTPNGSNSSLISNPQNDGNTAATLVAGVQGWTMPAGTSVKTALASKYFALYTQNTWRTTTKLLLSFGLRYEIQPGPTERYNRMSSVDLFQENPFAAAAIGTGNLGLITFPGVAGEPRNLWNNEYNNFAPRLGATYQLNANTVLRGGYGRTYTPSNTGFNANGLIYGTTPFSAGVQAIPYGLSPNGLPAGTFDQATTSFAIAPVGAVQAPSIYGQTSGVPYIDRTQYKNGYADEYNFFIERRHGANWLFSAGYVGSRSTDLPWRDWTINGTASVNPGILAGWRNTWIASNGANNPGTAQVPNNMPALIGKASGDSGSATITATEANEPYQAFLGTQSNSLTYTGNGSTGEPTMPSYGTGNYNSLELKVQHSMSNGLMFMANYTWSKAMGITGGGSDESFSEQQVETNGSAYGYASGVNYINIKQNHSLLAFDTPNRVVGVVTYELPMGQGKAWDPGNTAGRELLGGWQISGVFTAQSGNPDGVLCSNTLFGRCNRVAGEPLKLPARYQRWYNGSTPITLPDGRTIVPGSNERLVFNPDAWTQPIVTFANGTVAADEYQTGSSALTSGNLREPPYRNTNLSVVKKLALREWGSLDLHVDATNAFNHTNFYGFSQSVTSVTSTAGTNGTEPGMNGNINMGAYGITTGDNRELTASLVMTF